MSEIGVNTVVAGCDTDSGMRASADEINFSFHCGLGIKRAASDFYSKAAKMNEIVFFLLKLMRKFDWPHTEHGPQQSVAQFLLAVLSLPQS